MDKDAFVIHACEQVLRFSRVEQWGNLSEEIKVQLGFNMGAMALGLNLSKEEGFLALARVRKGEASMQEFHDHVLALVKKHGVAVDQVKIEREF